MSWTQPICERCYRRLHPHREPVRLTVPDREQCCMCGEGTADGIYDRLDPKLVPYPAHERAGS